MKRGNCARTIHLRELKSFARADFCGLPFPQERKSSGGGPEAMHGLGKRSRGKQKNFLKINLEPFRVVLASEWFMTTTKRRIFDEEYRVLAVESQRLTIQGVRSGEVLTIVTQNPEAPLTSAEYPPGALIALSDPLSAPVN